MPTTQPNLGLTTFAPRESGWDAGMNANLHLLDAACQLAALARDVNDPPASPAAGDRYLIGPAPTGGWAGKPGQVALWTGTAWRITAPKPRIQGGRDSKVGCRIFQGWMSSDPRPSRVRRACG